MIPLTVGVDINASNFHRCIFNAIGVGATILGSAAVDLRNAGNATSAVNRFMIPPKISSTQRGNLTGVVSGAIIYNTSLNKLQVFNGSSWVNQHIMAIKNSGSSIYHFLKLKQSLDKTSGRSLGSYRQLRLLGHYLIYH